MKKLLKIDFIRFGIVGGIGFCISEVLLFLLKGKLGMPLLVGFVGSNEGALISNFVLHETWTYKHINHQGRSLIQKLVRFHLSSWSGVAIVVGIGLLTVKFLKVNPYLGQAIGSSIAMFWNFFWTKYFIFKGHTPEVLLNPEDAVIEEES